MAFGCCANTLHNNTTATNNSVIIVAIIITVIDHDHDHRHHYHQKPQTDFVARLFIVYLTAHLHLHRQ